MSQSRFSIVLVGVSALLRRPLVSRLRPADGERSSWVVFTARGCRFDSGFRWAVGLRAHCFRFSACADSGCPRRVGLRVHRFRFSARTALELPSASWPSGSRLPLFGMHRFGVALGGLVLPLGGLAFGLTASAFRHAPLRSGLGGLAFGLTASAFRRVPLRRLPSAGWFFHLPLRRLPSAGWSSGSLLPLFGLRRFGVALGELALLPSVSEIAAGRVGLRAHCFRFSACADPHHRAAEARTDGAQRHDTCFTSKHLSQHVNLPHRTP